MTPVSLISLVEAVAQCEKYVCYPLCAFGFPAHIQQLRSECFMYSSEIQPHSGAIILSSSWSTYTYTYMCTTSSYSSCWFKKAAKPHLQTK